MSMIRLYDDVLIVVVETREWFDTSHHKSLRFYGRKSDDVCEELRPFVETSRRDVSTTIDLHLKIAHKNGRLPAGRL